MAKPHEMTLVASKATKHAAPEIKDETGTVVAKVFVPYRADGRYNVPQHDHAEKVAALFAAAPDMARALVEAREHIARIRAGDDDSAWMVGALDKRLADIDAALRKAGVL